MKLARTEPDEGGLTRRDTARIAAGSALTLVAASALGPLAAPAVADDYCFDQCSNDALNVFGQKMGTQKGFALQQLSGIGVSNAWSIAYWGGFLGQAWAALVYSTHKCNDPNCGDPNKYPRPAGGGSVGGGSGGGGGGGGSTPAPGCPPNTFACGGSTAVCCYAGNVCCSCGQCCTYAQYCGGCCGG